MPVESARPGGRPTRRKALGTLATAAGAIVVGPRLLGRVAAGTAGADPLDTASVVVDPAVTVGTIPERMVGYSFEKKTLTYDLFSPDNEPIIRLFQLLGPQLLRIGGNSVEREAWDPDGTGGHDGLIAPSDIARLRGFADAVGCPVIYSTPFYTGTADSVADEATVAVTTLGSHFAGLELCNEPDLYFSNPVAAPVAAGALFLPRWDAFAAAVRDRVPGVPLTGPATFFPFDLPTVFADFATPGRDLALLTHHHYRGFGIPPQTIEVLLGPDPEMERYFPVLRDRARELGLEYRLGETNSFSNGGEPGVSNAHASALFGIEHVFRTARLGCSGVHFHTAGVGQGYPAIVQVNGIVQEIRPLYYGLMLAADAGHGPLLATTSSVAIVDAHAIRRSESSLGVVLRNTDPTRSLTMTVDVGTPVASAVASRVLGPSLEATTGTTYRGATVGLDGSFTPDPKEPVATAGTTITLALPAASAVLVDVTLAAAAPPSTPSTSTTSTSTSVTPTTRPGSAAVAPVTASATPVAATPTFTG